LFLAGCGAAGTTVAVSPTPEEPSASTDEPLVTIVDFDYEVPVKVAPGATVRVVNDDEQTHTLTSSPPGGFDVSVPVDGTGTFTAPAERGEHRFVCLLHGGMEGVLIVG